MNQIGKNSLTSSRLSGTYWEQSKSAGQLQKEWFHNEALTLADLLLAGSVGAGPIASPPPNPVVGALYLIVASGAMDAFAGKENQLAGWTEAGWRFVAPVEGMRLTMRTSGVSLDYVSGAWVKGTLRGDELVIGVRAWLEARSRPYPIQSAERRSMPKPAPA